MKLWGVLGVVVGLVAGAAWSQSPYPADHSGAAVESASDTTSFRDYFSGENRMVYQFRSWEDSRDSDCYDYWFLRAEGLGNGWWDGYFSGRLHKDLDGVGHSLAENPFVSIEDLESSWDTQTYQLYVEAHDPEKDFALRVGRQYVDYADCINITGVNLELFQHDMVSVAGFLGRPVSYYSPTSGDWTGGMAVEVRPWEGGRARVEYVHYRDEHIDATDNFYGLDLWQNLGDQVRTHGQATVLDGKFEMGGVDYIYFSNDGDFDAVLGARRWQGLGQEARQFSPLFSVLGDLDPYTYLSARVTKSVLPWLRVSPGVAGRFVDGGERDFHNRQYGHYDLTLIVEPCPTWSFSLANEYWEVSQEDRFWGITGEAEYRHGRQWEAAVGTAYMDYQYQVLSDYGYTLDHGDVHASYDGITTYVTQVSPDAYTFYTRTKYRLNDWTSLQVRGELEHNSLDDSWASSMRTAVVLKF